MKIEKLRNPYVRGNEGCSVSMIDLLEKINEIIDAMNGEHDPADIYSEDGRLIAKKDESEDERIRKWLVDYFGSIKATVWVHRDITCEQILEWLEKQKENPKNAISIPADCVSDAKCEDRWHKTANSLPDDGRDVLAKDAIGNYLLASFDGAQWFVSVYDGEDHPVLHTPPILEWCEIPSEKQKEQVTEESDKIAAAYQLGRSDERKQKNWKPSEEQMNALNFAITYMFSTKANPTVLRDLYNDLLKLK